MDRQHGGCRAKTCSEAKRGLTPKAFLIALLLIPSLTFFLDYRTGGCPVIHIPTLIHPLSNVIFIIFLADGVSVQSWEKLSPPKTAVNTRGIAHSFMSCCALFSSLCSHDMMEILVTILGHPFSVRKRLKNEWQQLFWKELPTWVNRFKTPSGLIGIL